MARLSASRRLSTLIWPAAGLLAGGGLAFWQAGYDLRTGAALALAAFLAMLLGLAKTSSA